MTYNASIENLEFAINHLENESIRLEAALESHYKSIADIVSKKEKCKSELADFKSALKLLRDQPVRDGEERILLSASELPCQHHVLVGAPCNSCIKKSIKNFS